MYITKSGQAEKWLEYYLREHGRIESASVKKAGFELGFQPTLLARVLKRLNGTIISEGFPRRTYWEL